MNLFSHIRKLNTDKTINIMEVCGTHTMSLIKNGIDTILPNNINMISGPGCPVCVTPEYYIDYAIELSKLENVIITTFGDMIKVPGEKSSLSDERAKGYIIKTVYSPLDSIAIALANKGVQVIFLGVGFETTIPIIALAILKAKELNINNLSFLLNIKTMPNIMRFLLEDKNINIDGFICPGHVSTILGAKAFEFIEKEYNLPAVIAGFEALDLIEAINRVSGMIMNKDSKLKNLYNRIVSYEGNIKAKYIINQLFEECESEWRGIGVVGGTGLKLKKEYRFLDASERFDVNVSKAKEDSTLCICGDILKGIKKPNECSMYSKKCNPNNPIGACMVSTEGSCNIYYNYNS